MNYVAIDTSGTNLTLVVCKNGVPTVFHDPSCGVKHSVALMDNLEGLAERANFDIKDADFFAVVTGAGSFTGIRIGVSTVKALCLALNKPALDITSFDTVAYNDMTDKKLVVIDAKHGAYYVCGYDNGEISLPPCFLDEKAVKELATEYTVMAFEPLKAFENARVVSVADGLVKAVEGKKDRLVSASEITPLYIRKSQAEEGR